MDTHLSPKVVAPPDFTTRTTAVLNRIAEEHWRRQMREEQEKEEWKTEGKRWVVCLDNPFKLPECSVACRLSVLSTL